MMSRPLNVFYGDLPDRVIVAAKADPNLQYITLRRVLMMTAPGSGEFITLGVITALSVWYGAWPLGLIAALRLIYAVWVYGRHDSEALKNAVRMTLGLVDADKTPVLEVYGPEALDAVFAACSGVNVRHIKVFSTTAFDAPKGTDVEFVKDAL
jgi:hypothetical protein